ncbi:MAG TPA: DUF192 domain-containing protein [bacterium]|jgi:hypothetical protein|nr:DUF192 domain-containing protein [bacterium]
MLELERVSRLYKSIEELLVLKVYRRLRLYIERREFMKRFIVLLFVIVSLLITTQSIGMDIEIPEFPRGRLRIYQGDRELIIPIEIADKPELWSFGLMYREDIPWNYGMLFVFPSNESGGFWMKNTLVSLDIAFIDSSKTIFNIQRMVPCNDDDCPVYYSPKPYRYALEVKAGFFEKFGFSEGSGIEILSVSSR